MTDIFLRILDILLRCCYTMQSFSIWIINEHWKMGVVNFFFILILYVAYLLLTQALILL